MIGEVSVESALLCFPIEQAGGVMEFSIHLPLLLFLPLFSSIVLFLRPLRVVLLLQYTSFSLEWRH